MAGRFKLNPLEMLTLAAVIFTTWLFLQAALDAAEMYTTVGGPISQANQMLGIFGWMVATFGPIGLALVFWRLAKRFRGRWILHLLFLPST